MKYRHKQYIYTSIGIDIYLGKYTVINTHIIVIYNTDDTD